jgi:uncharacterized protein (TIGR02996 family)
MIDGRVRVHNDPGRLATRQCADAAAARRTYDKLVAQKLAAGFVLAPGSEPEVAQRDVDVHRNAELEAKLAADPDDATYLVYGDWLQARGDPRGELVHVQHAMRAGGDPATFLAYKQHDVELRAAHANAWLGEAVAASAYRMKLDWRLGFVETARVDVATNASEIALAPLVTALLASPAGCLVRTLIVRANVPDEFAGVLDALGEAPALRKLTLLTRREEPPVQWLVDDRPALRRLTVVVGHWDG